MAKKITRQDVEDFEAQERGFKNRRDERIHELENDVSTAEFVVEDREHDLQEAREALERAKSRLLDAQKRRRRDA